MKLVNLTPHSITLRTAVGADITIPSSGLARVSSTPGTLGEVEGVPVPVMGRTVLGEVVGLPKREEGVLLVVSAMVGSALAGSRSDVVCPGTGPADGAVRDEAGRIVAVTRLVRA